ncbi:MAG: PAS domain S-box protein [Bacteroidales bacterium]|nr:PAS domain S-box protein [Bacteroidales bacterium]
MLSKTEFYFQELFNKAAIPLCIINKSSNKLIVNNHFHKTFGYTSKDIPTLNDWLLLAYPNPDYRKFVSESCDKTIQKALKENTDFDQQEFNISCKNGTVLTMLITGSVIGSDYLITFFDITEKKKSIEESEMLAFALNNTSESVFIYKKDTNKFSYVNDQACRSLEYSREELLQLSTFDIDPDITNDLINKIKNTVYSGQSYIIETRHKTKTGRIFPVEVVATPYVFNNQIYTFSLVRDISKRNETEKVIRESEEKYRTLAENLPDNIIRYDNKCHTIYMNKVIQRTLNTKFDIIKNMSPTEIYTDGSYNIYEQKLKEVIKTGKEIEFEFTVPHFFPKKEIHLLKMVPECNENGKIIGALAIGRDITIKKQTEQDLINSEYRKTILNQIANIFLTIPDDEMYGQVLDILLSITKSKFGLFGYIDENGNLVIPSLTKDIWNECSVSGKSTIFPVSMWGNSLWGRAIREKKRLIQSDRFISR